MLFFKKQVEAVSFHPHFEVNDSVRLADGDKGYSTRVEDVEGEFLWLASPIVQGVPVRFDNGDLLKIISGARTGYHAFRAKVVGQKLRPLAQVKLEPVAALGDEERRYYARVPAVFKVYGRNLDAEPDSEEALPQEMITRDVSGGGLQVVLDRHHMPKMGQRVELDFELPGGGAIRCESVVAWTSQMEQPMQKTARMAICFTHLREVDRDTVIRYVFARQAQLRREGRI